MIKKADLRRAVSQRLKKLRETLSFTQGKMAVFFGLCRTSYTKKEIGETFPSYPVLHKLGTDFNVSLDWLICGKGSMFFKEQAVEGEKEEPLIKENINKQSREGARLETLFPKELEELLAAMEQIPLLYHETMVFFNRFKLDNKELLEELVKDPGKEDAAASENSRE